ncbi:PspA/IM30 family protein [Chengkuizengella axinellae]|uniref:PspA/IM30 family protein n=1 Tax=Chengkuizengella axinellae TaxID=3064388 RepID=A0ABT9IT46_9BACL|nr:PspA/IM30 family protein [Chengkuizengella sp. 2205SS18-9]MDP5272510.1 PspA/IM30 family protein [Chengkuizengella sp. 2205SS18-9]
MSLVKRIRDISVATLNDKIENAEDPVRFIDKYLQTQKRKLTELEKLYQQTLTHAHSVKQQFMEAESNRIKRENQAEVAVKAGEEQLAKLILLEKMQSEEKSEQYRLLYEDGKQTILELEEQIQNLKDEVQELVDKRAFYEAKIESIRLQKQLNQVNRFIEKQNYYDQSRSIDQKFSELEMQTNALREVRSNDTKTGSSFGGKLQSEVDAQFQQLKKKLEKER